MKTIRTIVVMFILISIYSLIFGQNLISAYDYPIKPGTAEWKELQTHQEKIKVCQIPEDTLKKLTPSDLLQTCINYPLISDMLAYDNLYEGSKRVIRNFNGLSEFLIRKNSYNALIRLYENSKIENYDSNWTSNEKGRYTFKFIYFEMLLSQMHKTDDIDLLTRKKMISLCLRNYYSMLDHKEIFGVFSLRSLAFLIASILEESTYQPFLTEIKKNTDLQIFLSSTQIFDFGIVDVIINNANQFLKNRR